eukprot:1083849-Rhodomonas_salina.1
MEEHEAGDEGVEAVRTLPRHLLRRPSRDVRASLQRAAEEEPLCSQRDSEHTQREQVERDSEGEHPAGPAGSVSRPPPPLAGAPGREGGAQRTVAPWAQCSAGLAT